MFASRDKLDSVMYLRVTSEEKAFIEDHAFKKDTTPSAIVRRALETYCKNLPVAKMPVSSSNARKRKARVPRASKGS